MTPLLPQLSKGFGRKKLIEMLPILFVSNPFFTSLVPFFFFFAIPGSKKIAPELVNMGVPFYYTCSNDSMSAVCQGRSKKFQSFLWISCMSLYMTCCWARGGRSSYPKSFSLVLIKWEKNILREKFIFWNFRGLFVSPPPILRANFSHFLDFYSLRPYKDVRKELDLSLQITRTNTLDVYWWKRWDRQTISPCSFQSSTQRT